MIFLLITLMTEYSRHGAPGTDTVVHDAPDGIEILGTVPKPTNIKHIRDAHFTETPIPDNEYPIPSSGTKPKYEYYKPLWDESKIIRSTYSEVVNMTQDRLYYHPASYNQYKANKTKVDNSPRYRVRYICNNWYSPNHLTPFFFPPGEIITLEYTRDSAIGSLSITINPFAHNIPENNETFSRILLLKGTYTLSKKVNTIGWPYGGGLMIKINRNNPSTELIISGVILCPQFIYGVTTDQEYEEMLKTRDGPILTYDSGNMMAMGPVHTTARDIPKRMNDAMKLHRSRLQLSQFIARDVSGYGNPQFGRGTNPMIWYFDEYMIPAAWAYAAVGSNYCNYPIGAITGPQNYVGQLRQSWGYLHETNHHHQSNWGIGYTGEVTNNVLNLAVYVNTAVPLARIDNGNGKTAHGTTSGEDHTHNYFDLWGENDLNLAFYSNMLQSFGLKKFREFIYTEQHDLGEYKKETYGRMGSSLLRASTIFGRDMRHHFDFHERNETRDVFPILDRLNLPYYHPITNFYTNGYVVDGEEFTVAPPLDIPADYKYIFKFNMYEKSRSKYGKDKWGEFVFEGLEGTSGHWRKLEDGVYEYTPLDDILAIDKFYLNYRDTTTNTVTKLVGTLKQQFYVVSVTRFDDHKDGTSNYNDIEKAFIGTVGKTPSATLSNSGMKINSYNSGSSPYLSYAIGKFKVPQDGDYTFYIKDDDRGMLYMSENELTGNPNTDKDYLIIKNNNEVSDYSKSRYYVFANMTAGTIYHFVLVCYNTGGSGYASIGYKFESENIKDAPNNWVVNRQATEENYYKSEYVPEFYDIPDLNKWRGPTIRHIDTTDFIVYKAPESQPNPTRYPSYLFDALTDSAHTFVSYWFGKFAPFPHVYEWDCKREIEFTMLNFISSVNEKMNSYIEFAVSDNNETFKTNYSHFYAGQHVTGDPPLEFNTPIRGRYFRLTVFNNTEKWAGNNRGGSSISEIFLGDKISDNLKFIIPATHTKIRMSQNVKKTRAGLYFNGYGYEGEAGSTYKCTFPKGTKQFVVIGDKFENMGDADILIDGSKAGTIDKSISLEDSMSLKYSTSSYRSYYFISPQLDESREHTFSMTVTSGKIVFAGFVSNVETLNSSPDDSQDAGKGDKGKEIGVTIGIVIGVIVVVAIVVGVIIFVIKNRSHVEDSDNDTMVI